MRRAARRLASGPCSVVFGLWSLALPPAFAALRLVRGEFSSTHRPALSPYHMPDHFGSVDLHRPCAPVPLWPCAALAPGICSLALIAHPITPSSLSLLLWPVNDHLPSPGSFLRDVDPVTSSATPPPSSLCFTRSSSIAPVPLPVLLPTAFRDTLSPPHAR